MTTPPLPGMPPARVRAGRFRCAGCGRSWGGYQACHCPICHTSFLNVEYFDAHRKAAHPRPFKVVR